MKQKKKKRVGELWLLMVVGQEQGSEPFPALRPKQTMFALVVQS